MGFLRTSLRLALWCKEYWFKYYAGTELYTKKKQYVTRRGFKTEKEAKLSLAKIQLDVEDR